MNVFVCGVVYVCGVCVCVCVWCVRVYCVCLVVCVCGVCVCVCVCVWCVCLCLKMLGKKFFFNLSELLRFIFIITAL